MKKAIKNTILSIIALVAVLAVVWFTNLFDFKERIYVNQIVKMRVSPERLTNPKTPQDYGMAYTDVDIITADNVRLSAWEIPAAVSSDKTLIVNHPLTATRYGTTKRLDDVSVEFLPMIKHLHDAAYNIVMYDHRGQGESDGGTGETLMGTESPVGVGETEWQDVVASLRYVTTHTTFGDDEIGFISQCMGASATFLAWNKRPELFSDTKITSLVAIQPPVSYNMIDRLIRAKTGLDLVDKVLVAQIEKNGFGYADILTTVQSLTVPVLYTQVRKDEYTYDATTARNDIEDVVKMTPNENHLIWIGPDEEKPHGTRKRFDGYGYFNIYPDELLNFLDSNFS